MKTIPHMHDMFGALPEAVRQDIDSRSRQRKVCKGETVYCQGDTPDEMYQLVTGGIKLCNYSIEGGEFVAAEFCPGDCFGEMGLIDGLPRASHAVATADSLLRVLRKDDFHAMVAGHAAFARQVMLTLCRRLRWTYGLTAEASGLVLQQRLALQLFRLAQSHGSRDEAGELYIGISQEQLGRMLGASRQSINKELKVLMEEGCVDVRYGKIYLNDLDDICRKYEDLLGGEQITAAYDREA